MKRALFAGFVIAIGLLFWPGQGQPAGDIIVNEGESAHEVARELKEAGLIQSRVPFFIWSKLRRASARIQIGRYRFSRGRSAFWIVNDLIAGHSEKVKVVVPEGFASWQIAERLDELKICPGSEFKDLVLKEQREGFLFPATYEVANGLSPVTVLRLMIGQFDQRWTPDMDARAATLKMTKKDVVTLASIVEREVRVRDELPLVAALYWNRLKKNMPLQADPTVQYAQGFWNTRLTYADYRKTHSPYNTYLHMGLPPGPICSPGEDAIKAVLWPAESHVLYMVANEDGRHDFSETYRDHTNKVNRRNRRRK